MQSWAVEYTVGSCNAKGGGCQMQNIDVRFCYVRVNNFIEKVPLFSFESHSAFVPLTNSFFFVRLLK